MSRSTQPFMLATRPRRFLSGGVFVFFVAWLLVSLAASALAALVGVDTTNAETVDHIRWVAFYTAAGIAILGAICCAAADLD